MSLTAIQLDQLLPAQAGHDATANQIHAALTPVAYGGVRGSTSFGLTLVLYGGVFPIAGVPTLITDQTLTLTASTTNYIYRDSSGVAQKTTSIPTGWPGPITSPAGATALYALVTTASGIDISNAATKSYRIGVPLAGGQGIQGIQGNPGVDLPAMHMRFATARGNSSLVVDNIGWAAWTVNGGTGAVARALSSGSFAGSICQVGYETGTTAGTGCQIMQGTGVWCYLGNGAGRGGFLFAMRFRAGEISAANQRSFFGLHAQSTAWGNVEPDTILNMVGVGAKAGDANFSFMHNDGAGSATMVGLGSNFPARATDTVYELLLQEVANSGVVAYSLTDVGNNNTASGSTSSDLPSNTTFLGGTAWMNNGSSAANAAYSLMQVVGETRY